MIFPEGGRSPDGWAQPFRGGAAYLARRTGRPVVPVHLDGTRHVLPKRGRGHRAPRWLGHRGPGGAGPPVPVTVIFGTPLSPREGEDARRFGARIEAAVATLADEVATDWWTARSGPPPGPPRRSRARTCRRGGGPGRSAARPRADAPDTDPARRHPGGRPA